ncbi:MAG: hypothetical protein VX589_00525 [Myxococcota bacterium]|nr:hypothetical protein [Myxococcota bacterium]
MDTLKPIVAFADHITTVLDLNALRTMSAALFDLGLSTGWPLSEQPGFSTAGIRLGNLNLELCAVDRQYIGLDDWLTFEPTDLDTLADNLAAQNLIHDPFDRVEAGGHPIYTRVGLPELATETTAIQVCRTFFPTRTSGPIAPANEAGITQVLVIKVGVDAYHRDALTRLFMPRVLTGAVAFDEGPNVVIEDAPKLGVNGLVIECQDIARAHAALSHAGLNALDEARLEVGSLILELVEQSPA